MSSKKRNVEAMRKAANSGAIITWDDKDADAPPPKPTKQTSLGNYVAPAIFLGGLALATIFAIKRFRTPSEEYPDETWAEEMMAADSRVAYAIDPYGEQRPSPPRRSQTEMM